MLKQPAKNKNFTLLRRIFEGISKVKALLETLECLIVGFDANAEPGGAMERDAARGKERLDIAKLPMDRSGAGSCECSDIRSCNLLLLVQQQLYNSSLPSRGFDRLSSFTEEWT